MQKVIDGRLYEKREDGKVYDLGPAPEPVPEPAQAMPDFDLPPPMSPPEQQQSNQWVIEQRRQKQQARIHR